MDKLGCKNIYIYIFFEAEQREQNSEKLMFSFGISSVNVAKSDLATFTVEIPSEKVKNYIFVQ